MKRAVVALSILCSGCAWSARSAGMQDPSVEIARTLAATQASTVKALTEALVAAQAKACPVEVR